MSLSIEQIERLGRDRDPDGSERLIPLLHDANPHVRTASATALGRIGDSSAASALVEALVDTSAEVRQSAAWALGALGHSVSISPLVSLLHDPSSSVRSAVIWALGQLGQPMVLPELSAVSRFDPDQRVRQDAATVVRALVKGAKVTPKPEMSPKHTSNLRKQHALLAAMIALCLIGVTASAIYFWFQPLGPSLVAQSSDESPQRAVESGGVPQCGGPPTMFLLLVATDGAEEGLETGSADVIRVARLDFVNIRAQVLAIPRDLWVTIPGLERYGISENRIKTAYPYGNHYDIPGRGISLLARTLSTNFGLTVEHYVVIDFETFAKGVDQLGGIDVLVQREIGQPGETGYLPAGSKHMDGHTALAFARVRPENSTDLARIDRQSQILLAARDKLLTTEGITQVPALVNLLQAAARTDLTPSQFSALLCLGQHMNKSDLLLTTIGVDYFVSVTDSFGYERLLPNVEAVRQLFLAFMHGDLDSQAIQPDN